METSLMLLLQDPETSQLVACAEISLRPTDGKLPGEFAVPALFLLHGDAPIGAYVSNVAVSPAYRQRGLASELLRLCERLVRGVWSLPVLHLHVDMHNEAAVALYRSLGYEQLPEYDDACKLPDTQTSALRAPVLNRYHRKMLSETS